MVTPRSFWEGALEAGIDSHLLRIVYVKVVAPEESLSGAYVALAYCVACLKPTCAIGHFDVRTRTWSYTLDEYERHIERECTERYAALLLRTVKKERRELTRDELVVLCAFGVSMPPETGGVGVERVPRMPAENWKGWVKEEKEEKKV